MVEYSDTALTSVDFWYNKVSRISFKITTFLTPAWLGTYLRIKSLTEHLEVNSSNSDWKLNNL